MNDVCDKQLPFSISKEVNPTPWGVLSGDIAERK
jgi:hypothetical protein